MALMYPKDFIKIVFASEVGQIARSHAYISFMLIGIGIEFLGKCMDSNEQDWNKVGNSRRHFNLAILKLKSMEKYRPYLNSHNLYKSLRCGMVHASSPNGITLSSKNEAPNLALINNKLNLKVEDFYDDFQKACFEVTNYEFPLNDKMNHPFIRVPSPPIVPTTFGF